MNATGLKPPTSIEVSARASAVLQDPLVNKDGAFTEEERSLLGLSGLLPPRVVKREEQVTKAFQSIEVKDDDLEKYIGLMALQDRNEVLFYSLLIENIERYLPILYTPTVGLATQRFSEILRRPRGLWISLKHKGKIAEVLRNAPVEDVRLIVVTDGERILGLGDLGAGGMGISIGKLSLYTLGAGIHPSRTLPICLDVGTDNEELLESCSYIGLQQRRLRGSHYDDFVEEFVNAVEEVFPAALLQWEDFKKTNAMSLLARYRKRLLSFNDDIQGTAAVGLAGVLAGVRATQGQLSEQRFVIVGAGAAGVGIAGQILSALEREGLSEEEALSKLGLLDSRGLLVASRDFSTADAYKKHFAWSQQQLSTLGLEQPPTAVQTPIGLEETVAAFQPTVLIGTSGQPGAFTEQAIRAMAEHVDQPLIFPFSNPTTRSEAHPEDLFRWTEGKAWVATGSPFAPVNGPTGRVHIGQGNNVYIFPGVGLGALLSEATEVTDSMFTAAAETLASNVTQGELAERRLYPELSRLRELSRKIALAVALEAQRAGVAPQVEPKDLKERIEQAMWCPSYPAIKAVKACS